MAGGLQQPTNQSGGRNSGSRGGGSPTSRQV